MGAERGNELASRNEHARVQARGTQAGAPSRWSPPHAGRTALDSTRLDCLALTSAWDSHSLGWRPPIARSQCSSVRNLIAHRDRNRGSPSRAAPHSGEHCAVSVHKQSTANRQRTTCTGTLVLALVLALLRTIHSYSGAQEQEHERGKQGEARARVAFWWRSSAR